MTESWWRVVVHGATGKRDFEVGARVFVRNQGKNQPGGPGTVLGSTHIEDVGTRFAVVMDAGGEMSVKRSILLPLYGCGSGTERTTVLVCATTEEYRALARSQTLRTDHVVEIGGSFGLTSEILQGRAESLIVLDVSPSVLADARKTYPDIDFRLLDVLREPSRLLDITTHCTKWFIDIGGNRDIEALSHLLQTLTASVSPQLVVIKSSGLVEIADRYSPTRGELTLENTDLWWREVLQSAPALTKSDTLHHPFHYPRRESANGVLICRIHNYGRWGCRHNGEECVFDHTHCHHCGVAGHIAKQCKELIAELENGSVSD